MGGEACLGVTVVGQGETRSETPRWGESEEVDKTRGHEAGLPRTGQVWKWGDGPSFWHCRRPAICLQTSPKWGQDFLPLPTGLHKKVTVLTTYGQVWGP